MRELIRSCIRKDPVEALPDEIFSYLLSSLPPTSIARLGVISQSWRQSILPSPILFRDLDLSSPGNSSKIYRLLHDFQRLSSLFLNQLVKVTLNLYHFFEEFLQEDREKTMIGLDCLFDILQRSRETLGEISFLVSTPSLSPRSPSADPLALYLMNRLQDFPNLKRIPMNLPTVLELKAGNDLDDGSKKFEFYWRGSRALLSDPHGTECNVGLQLLKAVKRSTGGIGFRDAIFSHRYSERVESSQELLSELSNSKMIFRYLDLCAFCTPQLATESWDFEWVVTPYYF